MASGDDPLPPPFMFAFGIAGVYVLLYAAYHYIGRLISWCFM
jgi:hypothetical protein